MLLNIFEVCCLDMSDYLFVTVTWLASNINSELDIIL